MSLPRRSHDRGPAAAWASLIDSSCSVSGASETWIGPRVGRSRSALRESKEATTAAAISTPAGRGRRGRGKRRAAPSAIRCADQLEPQDLARYPIVEGCDANRLRVDHLVERLDVEAWRARQRLLIERLAAQRPTYAVGAAARSRRPRAARRCPSRGWRRGPQSRCSRPAARESGCESAQKRLRPQVRGIDRVGLIDDRRASVLVAGQGEGQAEAGSARRPRASPPGARRTAP